MINKYLMLSAAMMLLGNILVWLQVNGQLIWKPLQNNLSWLCLAGVPIAFVFIKATEWGFEAFDGKLWPVRIISMAISFMVFTIMTATLMHELPDVKTMAALSLCITAIAIQVFL